MSKGAWAEADRASFQIVEGNPKGSAGAPKQDYLTICPACAHQISRNARSCPNCGHSLGGTRNRARTVAISAMVALLVAVAAGVGFALRGEWIAAPIAPHLSIAQVVSMVQPSVVTVQVKIFRGGTSEGSGFIYGKVGHVLTNAHVITRAVSIDVIDAAGSSWTASLIGINRELDLAELEINDSTAKPLRATNQPPRVGTDVIVIGNPFGVLPNTVTRGLVGGLDRKLTVGSTTYYNLIQTDAVVNPGNSGGPMVNDAGELVGMVTLGGSGYAFGIPVKNFDGDAKAWANAESPIALGPPNIMEEASSLILSAGMPPGFSLTKRETWNGGGYHVLFEKPPNYYGGAAIEIYLDITTSNAAAESEYQGDLSAAPSYGFRILGSSNGLGDEVTWLQENVKDQVGYEVVWRDRNAEAVLYVDSGLPPDPIVALATALNLAGQQESLLSANLAQYQ